MKALIVIDIQKGLMNKKIYKKQEFLTTINNAILTYELNKSIIVLFQHNNKMLIENTIDWEIDDNIIYKKIHKIMQKKHGNAFEETDLNDYLKKENVNEIVVCGLVTHGCVKATCLGGLEKGYKVSILKNGHSCWSADTKDKIAKVEEELYQLGIKNIEE